MTDKAKPILKLKRPRRVQRPTIPRDPKELLPLVLREQSAEVWNPEQPQPLAVGIHQQIIELVEPKGVSRTAVRRFLKNWTSTVAYQEAMSRPQAARRNIDGSAAGEVSEKHRRRAERRVELLKAEQQAEQPAAGNEETPGDVASTSNAASGKASTSKASTSKAAPGKASTGRATTGKASSGKASTARVSTGRTSTRKTSTGSRASGGAGKAVESDSTSPAGGGKSGKPSQTGEAALS